jgi:hypothetical protein
MTIKMNFSGFDLKAAFKKLQVTELVEWQIGCPPVEPSEFFQERLRRLQHFDLTSTERAKELLIDAVCEEAIQHHPLLKIWKAAPLQSDDLTGTVDYLIAPRRAYVETPLLCVVEAKKDDFEQGLAQCLIEMKACQWNAEQEGTVIDIYGIVTNGEGWKFYRLATDRQVFESRLYALGEITEILGVLRHIFDQCERNIAVFANAA